MGLVGPFGGEKLKAIRRDKGQKDSLSDKDSFRKMLYENIGNE